mgnify:CR=1 FL=1
MHRCTFLTERERERPCIGIGFDGQCLTFGNKRGRAQRGETPEIILVSQI